MAVLRGAATFPTGAAVDSACSPRECLQLFVFRVSICVSKGTNCMFGKLIKRLRDFITIVFICPLLPKKSLGKCRRDSSIHLNPSNSRFPPFSSTSIVFDSRKKFQLTRQVEGSSGKPSSNAVATRRKRGFNSRLEQV